MDKIKVVIVDDYEDITNYFKMILSRERDIEVTGIASSGREAYELVMQVNPDIVLMDVQMETELAGIEAITKLVQSQCTAKIIVLTIHEDDDILFKAYGAGAVDYIRKTSSIVDILNSIRSAFQDKTTLNPNTSKKILSEFSRLKNEQNSMIATLNIMSKLTKSEFEILKSLRSGIPYQQIARERYVEEVTIRTQVTRILRKFQAKRMKDIIDRLEHLKIFDIYKS